MQRLHLSWADDAVMLAYLGLAIATGLRLKRRMQSGTDFLLASRSIPAWAAGLAFLSANLGALEIMGMAASGAKYGLMTSHFYWLGAIPAMVFLGVFMMPFYYGSKARSVPEYLKLRFDNKTHILNALVFSAMMICLAGISLHALAKLLEILLDCNYNWCLVTSASVVLLYISLGGLKAAIYNEVIQFFLLLLGFVPLAYFSLKDIGGWHALYARLGDVATQQGFAPGAFRESWQNLGNPTANPMGIGGFGLVMGLGFVLSFGYWCTDFQVVQRAMVTKSMSAARRTPLIAAFPKMFFPALVVLPGLVAISLLQSGHALLPLGPDGKPDYNLTMPVMLMHYCPPGLLGLGFTALVASFMSSLAGSVTAFNTVLTYDLYQGYLAPRSTDAHYLWIGRGMTVLGIIASIGAAFLAARFNNIMDFIQLVCGFVNAPLFATFLLGMFWKRTTGHGAFGGLLSGTLAAALFHGLASTRDPGAIIKGGWVARKFVFQSEMGQNFWMAIIAWTTCFVLTVLISLATRRTRTDEELTGLVYSLTPRLKSENEPWYKRPAVIGIGALVLVIVLNIIFF